MPARPCLFVACAPSGSRIHPSYVKLFRKNCPAESTRTVERPKNQGPEQLRFFHRLGGRAEGLSGGHRIGVSAHRGAVVYCAPGAGVAALRELETTQGGCRRLAADLPGRHGGRGGDAKGRIRAQVGRDLPHGESDLAPELGTDHSVFRVSRRDPESDLHDQYDRVAEHVAAKNHQDARVVPERRRRHETAVFGFAECLKKMDDAGAELERGLESLQHSLAGTDARPGSRLIAPGGKSKERSIVDLGALPPSPWDLTHYRRDCWSSAERAALVRAESWPLSRRSGRVPAEPYPPPRCNQCSRKPSTNRKPFTQNS